MDAADPKDVLIEQLRQQLAAAQARIAELEAILRRHFPGYPGTPPAPARPPKPSNLARPRRRRGAQPVHKGQHRELVPLEQVTQIQSQIPSHCARCQQPLRGQDPAPLRHQESRGSAVCKELLGANFSGTLGSDRWSAYRFVPLYRDSCAGRTCCETFRSFAMRAATERA